MRTRVLVVATSRKTRGGITSVVKAHETGEQWKKYHCRWIQTHRDGPAWRKILYFMSSLIEYIFLLPFYDIVHIHVATGLSAKRKKIFLDIAILFGKKTILHFHPSSEKYLFEDKNKKIFRNLFSRANLVLVLSEQWKRWVYEALGISENIEVLYNPCPLVTIKPELKEKNILFAGTLIPRKGYEVLIRGFAKIAQKHKDWKVVFAGNGEIEQAKAIAEECGITSQTKFLGWVDGIEKDITFQKSSVYCLASTGEGFPMGVLDAWAFGLPCVVTPVGGIPDIVVDGKNGLIFDVGNIDMLAEKLDLIISNESLRESISAESLSLAQTTFCIANINKQLGDIYKRFSK